MSILLKKKHRLSEAEKNKRAVYRYSIVYWFTALYFLLSDACQSLDGILFNNNLKMFCEIVRHTVA